MSDGKNCKYKSIRDRFINFKLLGYVAFGWNVAFAWNIERSIGLFVKVLNKTYNHNILRHFDILLKFSFITSEMKHGY